MADRSDLRSVSVNHIELLSSENVDEFIPLAERCQKSYRAFDIPVPKNREFFRALCTSARAGAVHIYRAPNNIAGFTTMYYGWSTAFAEQILVLNDLFVADEYRRMGIATALMANASEFAKQRQINWIQWLVEPNNLTAQSLYSTITERKKDWIRYTLKTSNAR